jgi:hypothetical protein
MELNWKDNTPMNRLRTLLGPEPTHPWAALLPQALLWCFHRYCIQTLTAIPVCHSMLDNLWEDFTELFEKYGPKGINNYARIWLSPENVSISGIDTAAFSQFFVDVLSLMDTALKSETEEEQDAISTFLDEQIMEVTDEWLGPMRERFTIYPTTEEEDAEISDSQFFALIQAILDFKPAGATDVVQATPVVAPPTGAAGFISFSDAPPGPREPSPPPQAEPEPELLPVSAPKPVEVPTVAAALVRRRFTLRAHGPRSKLPVTPIKTHQRHAPAKTRRVRRLVQGPVKLQAPAASQP